MTTVVGTKRPRVIGIAGLSILSGLLGIYAVRREIGVLIAGVPPGHELTTLLVYISILLSVLAIVAGVLILMYKRIGLYLGAIVYGLSLLSNVISLVTGQVAFNLSLIVYVVIDLAILYFIYIYLTRQPDRTFFT